MNWRKRLPEKSKYHCAELDNNKWKLFTFFLEEDIAFLCETIWKQQINGLYRLKNG